MNLPWRFPADLSIVAWLAHYEYDRDFITDDDLDREGLAAIEPYNCVITGTLPHTKIIASSGGHSDNYMLVTEELFYIYAGLAGSLDYRIRGDIIYFTAPNDGAVFSTGSIAFGQALPASGFENTTSTLPRNVLDAFLKDGKLPGGHWTLEEKQWR